MVNLFRVSRIDALVIGQKLLAQEYLKSSVSLFRDDQTLYTLQVLLNAQGSEIEKNIASYSLR